MAANWGNFAYLAIAIFAEVAATSMLPWTKGFENRAATVMVLACYGAAFYFLSLAVQTIPVHIVYALWSGLGVLLVTVVASLLWRQPVSLLSLFGVALIVGGVVVLKLASGGANPP
jgi:small multidrug resistance pump